MLSRQGSSKMFDMYEHGLQNRQLSSAKLTATLITRNNELENYNRLQCKLSQITQQYSLLQLHTSQARDTLLKERRITEQTAGELRASIDQEAARLKSLTIALDDALGEADSWRELKGEREQEIAGLEEDAQDMRAQGERITEDRGILHDQRNAMQAEIRDTDSRVIRLSSNVKSINDKLQRIHAIVNEFQLSCETKSQHLRQYEVQNNNIDRQLADLTFKQDNLLAKTEQLQSYLKQLQFSETQALSDFGRLQSCLSDTRSYLATERDKHTDLTGKLKQRERLFIKLQKQLQQEATESDYLISKNGQVSEVNNSLRKDLALSEKHMQALLRNNEQLNSEIQNFRKQDRSILTQIENRTTPRTVVKLEESKVTEVSYRLRGSRLAEMRNM